MVGGGEGYSVTENIISNRITFRIFTKYKLFLDYFIDSELERRYAVCRRVVAGKHYKLCGYKSEKKVYL